jgi:uncharacterized protein (TIGR02588 family)
MAKDRDRQDSEVSPWEWAAGAVGLALVAATLAFLVHDALTSENAPPDFELRVTAVEHAAARHLVRISAVNRGDRTAADVFVRGTLYDGATRVETSAMRFRYVPAHSERRGGLYFERDPRSLRLALSVEGYEQP